MRLKRLVFIIALSFAASLAFAQTEVKTQCGTLTGQERFPMYSYQELPQFVKPDPAQWKNVKDVNISWGSKSVRYSAIEVPVVKTTEHQYLTGWKGERVFTQAVIWTGREAKDIEYEISDLEGKGGRKIGRSNIEAGFVRYVMADELNKDGKSACGERPDHTVYDSSMVADCIDQHLLSMTLRPMSSQAIWLTCWIPQATLAGDYTGTLTIKEAGKRTGSLKLTVHVEDKVLSYPEGWTFHLDLWQNPFAIARYYQVPLWSKEHLRMMRPLMRRLALAGQKVITASIIHWPWGGQTEDPFESMVEWTKKTDGSWDYDFSVFDKWVKMMMDCGIDKQINCYSMVPWKLSFQYFDEASNETKTVHTSPGEEEYENLWVGFLKAFAEHLKEKGWFSKTAIAMDERPMEAMKKVISIVREADPDFKIALAGNYYPEIESEVYDYCVAIEQEFPENVIQRRRSESKFSTIYTCCSTPTPNTFTFSDPDEASQLSLEVLARGADGYLRWAYNSWPMEPLLDSRFRSWASGDTYLVYPGNRSSIRFQRLIDGIQTFEKQKQLSNKFYIGTIVDENDNPVAGATVHVKGSTRWTVTDTTGRFAIEANPSEFVVVSGSGYSSREVSIQDQASERLVLKNEQ